MPVGITRKAHIKRLARNAKRIGLAASLILVGCESLQNAVAEGDTRTISLHHMHTGEDLTVTYKRNGRYDDEALKKLNHVLRDWRRDEEIRMDPRLIDLVWEVQRDLGAKQAVEIVCGYRAPATNSMLRHRSRHSGVAQFSQHMLGKAMDFYIPGVGLDDLRAAGLRLQRGGVGFYPTSGSPFVHLDVGSVRHWPRMTHDQLARIFPDGRTVHIPSDGQPLRGYAMALADIEKRGGTPSATSLEAAQSAGVNTAAAGAKPNVLARLFGFGKRKDDDEEGDLTVASVSQAAAPAAATLQPKAVATAPQTQPSVAVPLPKTRPAPVQVTLAETVPLPLVAPVRPAQTASLYSVASAPAKPAQPDNLFEARGYWSGSPDASAKEPDAQAAPAAPVEVASADPQTTGQIAPWPKETDDQSAGDNVSLGYAKQDSEPATVRRVVPMGTTIPRIASAGVTIAPKAAPEPAPQALPQPAQLASLPAASGRRLDDPWLRAMVLAPDVQSMTTTLLGAPDYHQLRPLLRRPSSALAMTFCDDPNGGMNTANFSGNAVVFLATATFANRTAALQ